MAENNNKVSVIILTKNEGESLRKCIEYIKHNSQYIDEIIIIDSSDDTNSVKKITNELQCKYYNKIIDNKNIKGINDLRNFGNTIASNDWCLHIDVDEIFPDIIFKKLNNLINDKKYNAYTFPRINLPFYELYPDYQTRLMNKTKSEWINEIHERVNIFTEPYEIKIIYDCAIIHTLKNIQHKLKINKTWNTLNKNRNVLICSLFKNSEKYLDNFLLQLTNLIKHSKNKNCNIDLCFIDGNNTDNTNVILKKWLLTIVNENINNIFESINICDNIDRFMKLAILRNMLIKLGLKNYHDYMLMIDSDTIFNKNLLEQLIQSIEMNQCDVIAPMPFIENFKTYKNEYFYDTLAFIDSKNNNFEHYYPYNINFLNKDLIKMNSVGTCYLIKSEIYNIKDFENFNIIKCYNESLNKLPIIYEGFDENNEPISEQITFFKKVKQKGFQIYVDKNIKILHINLENLGLEWH